MKIELSYLLTPFLTWFIAGSLKFLINSIKTKRLAFDLIGYGGLPSTHSSIVCAMSFLIFLKEGVHHPALGVALTLSFVVMLDANSLRRQVGRQAAAINKLARDDFEHKILRERQGHTVIEIFAGVVLGIVVGSLAYCFFD